MANVEENISRFMAAKENARRLIEMDRNGQLDAISDNARKSGKMEYKEENNIPSNNMSTSFVEQTMPMNMKNSKMPKEILESMTSNRIDTSALAVPGVGGSILDQLNAMTNGQVLNTQQPRRLVTENTVPQTTSSPQVSANVDYSMIKMIVEECMRKYSSSIKKTILNENKTINEGDELKALKIGNKFSFITKDGNLYEATLKFVKNIKE